MNQEKMITAEDRLRGPMIRCLDEARGIMDDCRQRQYASQEGRA
jgi:hypothetical protein